MIDVTQLPLASNRVQGDQAHISVTLLRGYVSLSKEAETLTAQLDEITRQMSEKEPVLREQFAMAGVQRTTLDGRTVYMHRSTYAGLAPDIDKAQAIEALKKAGYTQYVSEGYNSNSLSALLREFDKAGELDAFLVKTSLDGEGQQKVFYLGEKFALRVVKA